MMKSIKSIHFLAPLGMVLLSILFVFYSYAYIDLNLTLSSNSFYQLIQAQLIQLGYYQRFWSTFILVCFLIAFFAIYLLIITRAYIRSYQKILIGFIAPTLLLIFAYPAFSHDLFNYMFDARIVTQYGFDPHFFRALDFPQDTWTRFMHWTHRYYPYGIGWLVVTLIPSWFGLGKFVITLFLFKFLFLLFHIMSCWLIYKLMIDKGEKVATQSVLFYALSPLVLWEGLVSSHNEMMMSAFTLLSFYFLYFGKVMQSVVSLFISISTKYVSGILFPLFILVDIRNKHFFSIAFYAWLIALIPFVILREAYSWYVLPLVAIASLIHSSLLPRILITSLSIGLLSRYIPFVYFGDYTIQTQNMQTYFFFGFAITMSILTYLLWRKKMSL